MSALPCTLLRAMRSEKNAAGGRPVLRLIGIEPLRDGGPQPFRVREAFDVPGPAHVAYLMAHKRCPMAGSHPGVRLESLKGRAS